MPFDFKLPDLGEGIVEVELRRWLVTEGDVVGEHQPLLEVETDKAVVEVPSPRAGVVSGLRHKEGGTVKVGEILLTLAQREDQGQQPQGGGRRRRHRRGSRPGLHRSASWDRFPRRRRKRARHRSG